MNIQGRCHIFFFRFLFTIVLISLQQCLYSQDIQNIKFDNISIKDGLSQSSPNCIFQDSRGILWIGTDDGLNKYDGYTFTVFKPAENDPYSITNPRVLSICEDESANIWVGTNGGGLNLYDRKKDKFSHFASGTSDSAYLSGSTILALIFYHNQLWIGTDEGLSAYDPAAKRFADIQHDPALGQLTHTVVLSMTSDAAGLWIGTNNGLYFYDPVRRKLILWQKESDDNMSLPGNLVTAVMKDSKNNLWAGTENGLAMMKAGENSFTRFGNFSGNPDASYGYTIKGILEDRAKNIWVATFGDGLHVFLSQSGKFLHLTYDHNNPYSLTNNEVLSLFMDFSGIIWVGSNGLDKYNPKKEKFFLYDYVPFANEKLVFRNIHPIYEDQEGVLWIGSKTDGLHILDRKNKKYTHIIHQPGNPNSLSSNKLRAIKEYPEGTLWIGTEEGGLNRVTLDAGRRPVKYKSYRSVAGNTASLTSDKIYAIYPDNDNLLIGTDKGLTVMDINKETFKQFVPDPANPNSLSNLTVYSFYGDRSGNIWIATDFGVNNFNPVTGEFKHFIHNAKDTTSIIHNEILSFFEDSEGSLWIGTYGKGIDKFNIRKQTFTHFKNIPQLATAVIYGILSDHGGNLWLSTNNGIVKFNPKTGQINQFTIEDGLQSNEFNGTSYFVSESGEMFFGGQYGFNCFFPNAVVKDSVAPKIILSSFMVSNEIVTPGKNSPIESDISEVKEIILNYRQNNFTLYFSAIHFANPAMNRYKYRLEGFDNSWIEAGNRRFVSYTSLPYKTYTFRVKASNADGIWNDTGLSVKIKVKPPFWATIWFRILFVAFLLFAIYYLIRRRLRTDEQQKKILEEKFQTSTKELEEAQEQLEKQHDEIVIQKRELILREKDQENLLWFNQGLGTFSEIISKNKDSVEHLSQVFIKNLVEYVEAQQGAVFILNDDQEDNPLLELAASFALGNERLDQKFLPGEGYIGTCFVNKQFLEIDNVTEQYTALRSGLGYEYLKHLLFAPMMAGDQCIGVVELGSFKKVKGYRVSFIEKLMESFTSSIGTQKANARLQKLIDHSVLQSKELAESENQLRMNLEEIMATQEESTRREDELIKLAEESATHEEMLNQEIEHLQKQIQDLTKNSHKA